MKPKVYIARPVPKEVEEYIGEYCDYRKWEGVGVIPRDLLLAELKEVEGLLTVGGRIDAELLAHAPNLKVVSNVSVGYNNFIIEDMRARRVIGTNTPSVLDETVADLVMGLILATARRIPELDHYVKEGNWKKGDGAQLFGIDVHHATMGIIGLGRIGEAVATRARLGFQMNVLYHSRTRKENVEQSLGVCYAQLDDLLQKSDFVVLLTPLTPETTKFIGQTEFTKMKDTAIFINASRGQTVDEEALIDALQTGQIRGAGLDVFTKEPVDPANPLLKMRNVVAVPHIGSATDKTRFDMAMLAAQNLVKAVLGEMPPNLVEEFKNL